MKKERDLLDYAELVMEAAQVVQLSGVNDNLVRLRGEQRRANQALIKAAEFLADGEKSRREERKLQKAVRNAIWRGIQMLEATKKKYANDPIGFAVQLHLNALPISVDSCAEWEDKQRLNLLSEELSTQKARVKSQIGEPKYTETLECSRTIEELANLDLYIECQRLLEKETEAEEALKKELEQLNEEKRANPRSLFRPASWERAKDIEKRIADKQNEIDELPCFTYCEPLMPPADDDDEDFDPSEIANERLDALTERFEERNHAQALQYRADLLESARRCLVLQTMEEAERFVREWQ